MRIEKENGDELEIKPGDRVKVNGLEYEVNSTKQDSAYTTIQLGRCHR